MSAVSAIRDRALLRAHERGVFTSLDIQFATRLANLFAESSSEVVWGVALACRQEAHGHVCADLPALVTRGLIAEIDGESRSYPALPEGFEIDPFLAALRRSRLIGRACSDEAEEPQTPPLVLDEEGRLYLRRNFRDQATLAETIRARAQTRDLPIDLPLAEAGIERLAPARAAKSSHDGIDPTQRALRVGLTRPLAVITGGPGTGKTTLVARLIALLIEQAVVNGERLPAIRLLAPTGKAAAAMTMSFQRQRDTLDVSESVRNALPTNAETIHRVLLRRTRTDAFGRERMLPIDADIVVVDEASMVDLAMMRTLFSACQDVSRIVLLGDPDQLASVDSGAVLAELCRVESVATDPAGLRDSIVTLRESHRFASGGGVGRLAEAIRSGDGDAVLSLLDDPGLPEISRADATRIPEVRGRLVESVQQMQAEIEAAGSLSEKLERLGSRRVLCAHRGGPLGVEALCEVLDEAAAGSRHTTSRSGWWRGRLLLVTRNAPEQDLWNGDVGLVEETPAGLRALFAGASGGVRTLSAGRLPTYESAVAMSVHKSQGSEFDSVDLVLGNSSSRLMTRELLYTGVTRARSRLCVHASEAAIRDALGRRVERDSALAELLMAERA